MTAKNKISRFLKARGLDALLITGESNIRYLCGFACKDSAALLLRNGKCIFLTDARNFGEAGSRITAGTSALCIQGLLGQSFKELFGKYWIKRLGLEEENTSLGLYRGLKRLLRGVSIVPTRDIVEGIREIKTKNEIRILKRNAAITKKILKDIVKNIKPGKKERDLASYIEARIKREAALPAFEPIVASGPNSAKPHAIASERKIKRNDIVLIDFGISKEGYNTDITRTYFIGLPGKRLKKIYKEVETLQEMAIDDIRPGITISSAFDRLSRYLDKKKLGKFFLHGLGHGIGMDVHEKPLLFKKNKVRIREGMVFTIEPGLYIPGLGGVRIEDMVLVNARGGSVLTR